MLKKIDPVQAPKNDALERFALARFNTSGSDVLEPVVEEIIKRLN
ncbi:hypothetical protein [Pseudovibrio axinellae]|nr:hypothetical protein [Pseudovibrio axinellae]